MEAKTKMTNKKILIIAVAIVCVCAALAVLLTQVILPQRKYNEAMTLIDSGNYEAAYILLGELQYKDSTEKQESILPQYYHALFVKANVGDTIIFGSYEQDNDSSNGKENIEWLMLTKKDDKLLVVSQYALDCQPYNTEGRDATWETCTLRKWLNDEFFNEAFSAGEQTLIPTMKVTADKDPYYEDNTRPGKPTEDKIFLLSVNEAEIFFRGDEARKCVPTAYAIANGAYTNDDYTSGGVATCWWWLRSPGRGGQTPASGVYYGGAVDYYRAGFGRERQDDCVRPAMWIDLNA